MLWLYLYGAGWYFERPATNLQEFCRLLVCNNTIRRVCQEHGGAMRDWQRDAPAASAAFRAADGDVEFQTDGTAVNTTQGWRELRLSVFAKRRRGRPPAGPGATEPRHLPAPHRGHTDYAGRLAEGRSIGSGMVEGACKQVVGRRLKQTGARWKVRRVERMAALCAVQASDQWEAYWATAA